MVFAKLGLGFTMAVLGGCGGLSNKVGLPLRPHGDGGPATHYTQSAPLNILQTHDQLNKTPSNAISLKGTGASSTYGIFYNFNSKGAKSFRLVETSFQVKHADCPTPQAKTFLRKVGEANQEIDVVGYYSLERDADYVLEVQLMNPSCKELELSFDLLAWSGEANAKPTLALVCESEQLGQTIFVPSVDVLTARASRNGNETFLSPHVYCGEAFVGKTTRCEKSQSPVLPDIGSPWPNTSCISETDGERRSFTADFDQANQSGRVICKSGDTQTFSEVFSSCRYQMVSGTCPASNGSYIASLPSGRSRFRAERSAFVR